MGVLQTLTRVFRGQANPDPQPTEHVIRWDDRPDGEHDPNEPQHDPVDEHGNGFAPSAGQSGVAPSIEIKPAPRRDADADTSDLAEAAAPRNKQELLAELRKNYNEVVSLIRKVDQHLDRQDQRSRRLLEIAERLPAATDTLSQIRDQHERLNSAVKDLIAATREGTDRADSRNEQHVEVLSRVEGLLRESGDTEKAVAETIEQFRGAVDEVAGSNSRLASTMETINKRDADRDDRLEQMISRAQKWMIALVSLGAVGVTAAIVMAIILALG